MKMNKLNFFRKTSLNKKMNKHLKIIIGQGIFLVLILAVVYFMYPRVEINVNNDLVKFSGINAKVIMISENSDFSNSRYIDLGEVNDAEFNLKPGTYYWKADNGIISGLKNEFTIDSEVGLEIEREDNESDLVNVGNVKINVSKSEGGIMVGHIILEPDETEKIEDKGEYLGRQEND